MLPIRDDNPSSTVPVITRLLIAVNVAAFLFELSLGPALGQLFLAWGLVPQRLLLAMAGGEPVAGAFVTVFTSMFLHGGWIHLLGNMWYLWLFGDNVEDAMGRGRFLLFYLAGGVVSALLQAALSAGSAVPTVGASGAIAAVLGAYAVLYPKARVVTLVPIFFFFQIVALPALLVLGLWFVVQFFSGTLALGSHASGGVAWWAHIGGFISGLVLVHVFKKRDRRPARRDTWWGDRV
jgi:membrane associated rhomboid family serine protease